MMVIEWPFLFLIKEWSQTLSVFRAVDFPQLSTTWVKIFETAGPKGSTFHLSRELWKE